jgi:hypothetical protein
VNNSTSVEHGNRPVQGRTVLQKNAVQNDEVGKLAFRDCRSPAAGAEHTWGEAHARAGAGAVRYSGLFGRL